MSPVAVNVPAGARIYNFLHRARNPEYLVQDILVVELPSRVVIDVGWYPEHDVDGEYCICVYREDWDDQLVSPITTRDVDDVVQVVQLLASHFSTKHCVLPDSTTSEESITI